MTQPTPVAPSRGAIFAARALEVLLTLAGIAWMVVVVLTGDKYDSQLSTALWIGTGVYVVGYFLLKRKLGGYNTSTKALRLLNWLSLILTAVFAVVAPGYLWLLALVAFSGFFMLPPVTRYLNRVQADARHKP